LISAAPSTVSERVTGTFVQGRTLFILFSLSGFVGVLAEQVFEKMLSVVVGSTTPAAAIVISVYFIGLSAGAWLASFLLKRLTTSSLRLYGFCELGVAACCLSVWLTFTKLEPWYEPLLTSCGPNSTCLSVARFVIAGTIVFPTAVGLGLSFPFLSDLASKERAPAHFLAKLYFVNLLGAALCALLAPYLIFPWIGLSGGILISGGVDLIVGCRALQLANRFGNSRAKSMEEWNPGRNALSRRDWLVLAIAFVSGVVFFALEVLWTHLAGVVAGTSVYAFSSMLFVVLLGLALGSIRIAANARAGKPPSKIGALFFLSSSLMLVQLVWWQYVPPSITIIGTFAYGFYTGELARLLSLVAVLLPFTYAYGMIYPCLFHAPGFGGAGAGRLAGYMGFANAIGCVAGAALGFFVLIPRLGSETSLRLLTVVLALCGVVTLRLEGEKEDFKPSLVSAAMLSLLALLFPAWNRDTLTSGANVYFGHMTLRSSNPSAAAPQEDKHRTSRMIFFHEDSYGGVTTVREDNEDGGMPVRTLLTNGKFQGDDAQQTSAQMAFTLIPALHLRRRDNALMIGCGTGQSVAVLHGLGFHHVDLAEIAPGILRAARSQFGHINDDILDSPRTRVFLEDGRNVLLRRPDTYDLVAIELTSVWFAGAANIYSHEFYELAKRRLRPDGIVQQWLQLHHISPREVESIIGTLHRTFPYVSLWVYGGQGIVLGSLKPFLMEPGAEQGAVALLGKRAHGDLGLARQEYGRFLAANLLTSPDVDRLLRAHAPMVSTDWNRWLEFSTPRYNVTDTDWGAVNLANLRSFAAHPQSSP
jgi:spermidine synthase